MMKVCDFFKLLVAVTLLVAAGCLPLAGQWFVECGPEWVANSWIPFNNYNGTESGHGWYPVVVFSGAIIGAVFFFTSVFIVLSTSPHESKETA